MEFEFSQLKKTTQDVLIEKAKRENKTIAEVLEEAIDMALNEGVFDYNH